MHFRKKKSQSRLTFFLKATWRGKKAGRQAGNRKAGSKELRRGNYEFSVAKILERKKTEEGKQCV